MDTAVRAAGARHVSIYPRHDGRRIPPSAGERRLSDLRTQRALKKTCFSLRASRLGVKPVFLRLERNSRAQLEAARPARAEDIAEAAGGLPEARRQEVVGISAEIRRIQHVENLAEKLPFQALPEAEQFGHAQILRIENVPGFE